VKVFKKQPSLAYVITFNGRKGNVLVVPCHQNHNPWLVDTQQSVLQINSVIVVCNISAKYMIPLDLYHYIPTENG